MRSFVLIALLMVSVEATGAPSVKEVAQARVHQYFEVLRKESPTVEDFYRLEGEASEREIAFEHEHCVRQQWTPPENDVRCLSYIRERWASKPREPSLFLAWLKNRLPVKTPPIVISVSRLKQATTAFAYRTVRVKSGIHVLTFKMAKKNENSPAFGLLEIDSIDGKKIDLQE